MNRIAIAAATLAAAGGAWFFPWSKEAVAAGAVPARDLFTVRRADLRITLTENGTMVAKDSQKVAAKIRNESKIVWLVEEGKDVKEGDVVCKLDEAPAKKLVEDVQLEILQTEANLKTAVTERDIQKVEGAANERKATIGLDKARKEAEKYTDGEAPQARRKLEVALTDAETKFVRVRKKLEDSEKLLKQNYIKKTEYEDNEIEFRSVKVQLESAQKELELYDKYTFPMTTTEHESKVADAERELDNAKKRAESTLGQKEVAVQQVEKRLKMLRDQLKEREEDLANMTMKAPCPGLVVYGDPQQPWYRERVKVGNQIYGGHTVCTVPDLRVMQVRLQIHEADISKLKTGLRATVTTDSYPGMLLDGEITKIASVANGNEDWGGSSEVKKFAIEVTMQTKDLQLRPGVSAKVEIHVDVREKALFVPLQCVFAEDGAHWCHVQEAGKPPTTRKVGIGAANDNYLEILDGLQEGEQVLLYNPLLPETGPAKPGDATRAPDAKPDTPAPAAQAKAGS